MATPKVIDIKILKGRCEDVIEQEKKWDTILIKLAEDGFKTFIQNSEEHRRDKTTINQWIHNNYISSCYYTSPVKIERKRLKEIYMTPDNLVVKDYIIKIGLTYPVHRDEVSIEKQILTMLGEGWVKNGQMIISGNDFFQEMVKYEEPLPEMTLGMRRKQ
jgi:hypothetical protein